MTQRIHYAVILSFLFPIPIPLIAIILAIGYSIIKKQLHPIKKLKQQPIIHMFFCVSLLASLLMNNIVGSAVTICIYILYLYTTWLQTDLTLPFFHNALRYMTFGSWIHSVYAILQSKKILFGPDYHAFHPAMISWRDGRADAVFLNPNYYAMMCIFIILIALYQLHTKQQKTFPMVTIFLNVIGMILTQSRAALPTLVLVCLLFVWLISAKKHRKYIIVGAFSSVLSLPLLQFLPRFDVSTIISHLIDIRFQIWEVSLQHATKTLLIGSGPLTYMSIYDTYGSYATQHSHNLYVDALLNYGIIGVMLLCVIVYHLINKINKVTNVSLKVLGLCFIATVFIHGMLDVSILWVHTLFTFAFVIAFCMTDIDAIRGVSQSYNKTRKEIK